MEPPQLIKAGNAEMMQFAGELNTVSTTLPAEDSRNFSLRPELLEF